MRCKNCGNDPLDASLEDVCDSCRFAERWRKEIEAADRANRWAPVRRVVVVAAAVAILLWWLL